MGRHWFVKGHVITTDGWPVALLEFRRLPEGVDVSIGHHLDTSEHACKAEKSSHSRTCEHHNHRVHSVATGETDSLTKKCKMHSNSGSVVISIWQNPVLGERCRHLTALLHHQGGVSVTVQTSLVASVRTWYCERMGFHSPVWFTWPSAHRQRGVMWMRRSSMRR